MDYPIQTPDQLRQYIIGLRKKAGYSQEEAGALLGLTQQGYQRLERNPGNVSFTKIMRALQVLRGALILRDSSDQANLIDEPDNPPQNKTGPGHNLTPEITVPRSGLILQYAQGLGPSEKRTANKVKVVGIAAKKLNTPQKKASKTHDVKLILSGNPDNNVLTKVIQKNQGKKVDW